MKLLFATDFHYSERAPRSRQDAFGAAILKKLEWVMKYGNREEVDFFLDGGDIVDKAVQSIEEINKLYEVLKKRRAPTLALVGNHPVSGNVDEWRPRSGLFLLEKMLGDQFQIIGNTVGDFELGGWKFRMVHEDVLLKPAIWKHTLWKDYEIHDREVILLGHYHPKQGYKKIENVYFAAPGAMSRGTLAEDNLKRKPACTLITLEGRKITFKHVTVPHRAGSEILDNNAVITIEDVHLDDLGIEDCVDAMREMEKDTETVIGVIDILKLVRSTMIVSDEAYDLAAAKLEEKRRE